MIQLERKQLWILLILAGVILFGGGYRLAEMKEQAAAGDKPALEAAGEKGDKDLVVHVAGAVSKPGVYQLAPGSRIIDAVEKAGPTAEADMDSLQLAAPVPDGKTIYVPVKAAAAQAGIPAPGIPAGSPVSSTDGSGRNLFAPQAGKMAPGATAASGLVNINTANESQLDTLPGIGPSLAQRIIQHREVNGPFKSIEDVKNVSGIGDKKFEDIKDKITVW